MSSQYEAWYFIRDGKIYYHYENDGYQAMRRGLEATDTLLGTVEGVKHVLKNSSKVSKEIEEYEQELLQKSDGTGS
tara:strand:+ start:542 stop:769 length:228 start_codon:yes stop_codon:yes gene_type:complete